MKKLLSTTTALSLALGSIQPWPLLAQDLPTVAEDGSILAADGTVLCAPTPEVVCDPVEFGLPAEETGASETEGEPVPEPVAEDPAPEAAEAVDEPAAQAEEAPVSAETVEAAPDQSDQQGAEAEPQAPAEGQATEADGQQVLPEAPQEALEATPTDEASATEVEDAATAADVVTDQPVDAPADPVAEVEPAAPATAESEAAEVDPPADQPAEQPQPADPLPEEVETKFEEAAAAEAEVAAEVPAEPVAPVDVPVVPEEAVQVIENLLTTAPTAEDATDEAAAPAAAAALPEAGSGATNETAAAEPEAVTETEITAADTRSSFEEFAAAPKLVDGGTKKSGLSDLEKAGLLALGAIVVGKILSDGREVVANTGDRVVVKQPDGAYQVYKDDDTLLRRPGARVRTETFSDGSTRTIVRRDDGADVVTIRDATGRVLRRAVYDQRGNEIVLIDDVAPETRIDVSTLPEPRPNRTTISTRDSDPAMRAELARIEAQKLGRSFSLRQIREVKEVRRLAATIDVDNITFDSGSAVIRTTEARKLADLGGIMGDILDRNPYEVFLIEGHTDAVGSASSNLTLSDRRAESVALVLTEYFGIPPENMVVQGYGEYDLRVQTDADERRNRRVAVRLITPLMRTASR